MTIKIETLETILGKNGDADDMIVESFCCECGCAVKIEICCTCGGYGFKGGILMEPKNSKLLTKCLACHNNKEKLSTKKKADKLIIGRWL